MCPGTGHRICNDCMKACIYQKQEPVNIPQIETGVLTDVLELPWGVEIYGLLTRWNPLNVRRPYALPYNGKNVLVVGLGPAGYTLAHYLLNEGFGVVGIDGLKIEPLPARAASAPSGACRRARSATGRDLSARSTSACSTGFGGVSEYGITVRWDKNFLDAAAPDAGAARRSSALYGGVRFGGTLDASTTRGRCGFDHVAIAAGAGRPTIIDMKNNLIRGVRKASDFLMALQLTGAFKRDVAGEPAGAAAGGRHRRRPDRRSTPRPSCWRTTRAGREDARALRDARARSSASAACCGDVRRRGAEHRSTSSCAHGRAVRGRARRARAGAARRPTSCALVGAWGGVTHRLPQAAAATRRPTA